MILITRDDCRWAEQWVKRHECICGGVLLVAWIHGSWVIRCGKDLAHTGFKRVESWTDLYKRGVVIPLEIQNRIEAKLQKEGKHA